MEDIGGQLPGEELVRRGTADLAAGRRSEAALLLAMATTRRRAVGIDVPASGTADPAHQLYELLSELEPASAHSRSKRLY